MKQLKDIKRICNLGCGTMGFGTAIAFAQNGYEVNMFGRKDASIARGYAKYTCYIRCHESQ